MKDAETFYFSHFPFPLFPVHASFHPRRAVIEMVDWIIVPVPAPVREDPSVGITF